MTHTPPPRLIAWLFSLTVFLSAALLFQIQPLMSKLILPWFGGSSSVWTVCLLFFQSVLFLGYLFAHGLIVRLSPRTQWLLHSCLLAVAVFAPILPADSWMPDASQSQVRQILVLLCWNVGLPYLLLSATSPLVQVWYSRACPGASPYRLYALSNLGSMLGLLAYPFLVDVWLAAPQQTRLWSIGFQVFAVLCSLCGWFASRESASTDTGNLLADLPVSRAGWIEQLIWFLLAMLPSLLLCAVTTKLSVDVSPVPFMWVVPLTLYLVSLIVCFSWEFLANRKFWVIVTTLLLSSGGYVMGMDLNLSSTLSLLFQFAIHLGTFFAVCMACHGEMVRLKPIQQSSQPTEGGALTQFYLVTSAGGAAGSLFVAVIAPVLFKTYFEYPLALILSAAIMPLIWAGAGRSNWKSPSQITIWAGMALTIGVLIFGAQRDWKTTMRDVISISRSFFGVVRVVERGHDDKNGPYRTVVHGGTWHGFQMQRPDLLHEPTSYYGRSSGVGRAMETHHADRPRRIAVVGLGAGTLATYGSSGDTIDFYEIDNAVVHLAKTYFRFLEHSKAQVQIIPGDARISLLRGQPQQYDILVLDAFSSDAIPIHLLTREAFEIYRRQLAPDAVIAAHISNRYFELSGVLAGHAKALGWKTLRVNDVPEEDNDLLYSSDWILMSASAEAIDAIAAEVESPTDLEAPVDWTDSRHNLLDVLMY